MSADAERRVLAAAARWREVRALVWPTATSEAPAAPRVAHSELRKAERELERAVDALRGGR